MRSNARLMFNLASLSAVLALTLGNAGEGTSAKRKFGELGAAIFIVVPDIVKGGGAQKGLG